ncbi:MAG TPA: DNA polymerase III subunit delta [Polyangiales bacterium]|nr:DNA polymerase III subunit delta [Polyangiales bacterium]
MSLDALIEAARGGTFPPVSVIAGSERLLAERAVDALRTAAQAEPGGFNSDVLQGQGLSAQTLINTARMLPMMAQTRFILVRHADAIPAGELDAICAYVKKPVAETCLVFISEKLDGRSKLAKAAQEVGAFHEAAPPQLRDLPPLLQGEARARGHQLSSEAAQALADALGADLSALDDALERLSLYVGEGEPIELDAVEASVPHARTDSVWALVDAVGARNKRAAIASAGSLLGSQEPPLRILALLARQMRTIARVRSALKSGLKEQEAAQKAGAPPFKARDLAQLARKFDDAQMRRAFQTLAEADLLLKGSKVPGPRVLENALLSLCS